MTQDCRRRLDLVEIPEESPRFLRLLPGDGACSATRSSIGAVAAALDLFARPFFDAGGWGGAAGGDRGGHGEGEGGRDAAWLRSTFHCWRTHPMSSRSSFHGSRSPSESMLPRHQAIPNSTRKNPFLPVFQSSAQLVLQIGSTGRSVPSGPRSDGCNFLHHEVS